MWSFLVALIEGRRARWKGHVAHIGRAEVHTEFWWGTLKGREHIENLDADGRLIQKMALKEIDLEGMDFTDPIQEGGKWRALVNAAINLRVP